MVVHSKKSLRVQSRNVALKSHRMDMFTSTGIKQWQEQAGKIGTESLQLRGMVKASSKRRGLLCVKLAMGSNTC